VTDLAVRPDLLETRAPADLDAERAVIGACLLAGRMLEAVNTLAAEDFYRPLHAHVWRVMLRADTCDPIALADLMTGPEFNRPQPIRLFLHECLASVATAANSGYHANIVRDKAGKRRLAEGASRILTSIATDTGTFPDLLERAEREFGRLSLGRADVDPVDTLMPLHEFLGESIPEPDWLIPGLLCRDERLMLTGPEGLGKGLALSTSLPTPDGWTTMGAVKVGDQLLDADGLPTTVTFATEVQRDRVCYRVKFSGGAVLVADADHLWLTETLMGRGAAVANTAQIRDTLHAKGGHALNHAVRTLPLQLPAGHPAANRSSPPSPLRYITAVEPTSSVPVRCIQVDNPAKLYLAGVEMIPTHNTTLMRQLAICCAAGCDPFNGRHTEPQTVLCLDFENPPHITQKRWHELNGALVAHQRPVPDGRMWLDRRPQGMDLSKHEDRRWIRRRVQLVNPDLLVIGPVYKLMMGATSEDRDEVVARTVQSLIDELRGDFGCGVILEHHAGNAESSGKRELRPFGSSLWRRWVDFGYGIREVDDSQESKHRRLVEFRPWKYPRDPRTWPERLESAGVFMPWVEAVS
jgi:hypothetical protein